MDLDLVREMGDVVSAVADDDVSTGSWTDEGGGYGTALGKVPRDQSSARGLDRHTVRARTQRERERNEKMRRRANTHTQHTTLNTKPETQKKRERALCNIYTLLASIIQVIVNCFQACPTIKQEK
eukprot:scaffold695_cov196-Alexandrium_tamarense.AAC.25